MKTEKRTIDNVLGLPEGTVSAVTPDYRYDSEIGAEKGVEIIQTEQLNVLLLHLLLY